MTPAQTPAAQVIRDELFAFRKSNPDAYTKIALAFNAQVTALSGYESGQLTYKQALHMFIALQTAIKERADLAQELSFAKASLEKLGYGISKVTPSAKQEKTISGSMDMSTEEDGSVTVHSPESDKAFASMGEALAYVFENFVSPEGELNQPEETQDNDMGSNAVITANDYAATIEILEAEIDRLTNKLELSSLEQVKTSRYKELAKMAITAFDAVTMDSKNRIMVENFWGSFNQE